MGDTNIKGDSPNFGIVVENANEQISLGKNDNQKKTIEDEDEGDASDFDENR